MIFHILKAYAVPLCGEHKQTKFQNWMHPVLSIWDASNVAYAMIAENPFSLNYNSGSMAVVPCLCFYVKIKLFLQEKIRLVFALLLEQRWFGDFGVHPKFIGHTLQSTYATKTS